MAEEKVMVFNLRKDHLKNAKWKRTSAAVRILKERLAKFTDDRSTESVKLDAKINDKIWKRGARKATTDLKLRVRKIKDGKVKAELAE